MSESQYFSAEEGLIESVKKRLSLQESSSHATGFKLRNAKSAEDSTLILEQPASIQNLLPYVDASNAVAFSNRHSLHTEYSNMLRNSAPELSSRGPNEASRTLEDIPISSSIRRLAAFEVFSKIPGLGPNNPVREDLHRQPIMHRPPSVQDQPYALNPRIWPTSDPSSNVDGQPVLEHNDRENVSAQTLTNQNMVKVAAQLLATLNHEGNLDLENPDFSSRGNEGNIDIGNQLRANRMEKGTQQGVQYLAASQLQKLNNHPIRDEDIPLGESVSTFGGAVETLPCGTSKYSSMDSVLSSETYVNICKGNRFSPYLGDQTNIVNNNLTDQRLLNVVNQLPGTANCRDKSDVKNSYLTSEITVGDIAVDYLKLYSSTRPENYDFAMNIMAYIELLNDNSWRGTYSYFDENVKRLIKDIWNEQKPDFDNRIDLRGHSREMILKLLFDLNQWSKDKNFDLRRLLSHFVIMSHIGVFARKRIFKSAPLYVIEQLRERIKSLRFHNIMQFLFEIVVKEYGQKRVQHFRM